MAKRATSAQVEHRTRLIYELLLINTPYRDVLRYAATNWGVKPRTTDTLIKKATDLISEEAAKIREEAMEFHLAQMALLANKVMKDGDRRLFFDILRDKAKLLDLYPAARHELTGKEGEPIKVIRVESDTLDWDGDDDR